MQYIERRVIRVSLQSCGILSFSLYKCLPSQYTHTLTLHKNIIHFSLLCTRFTLNYIHLPYLNSILYILYVDKAVFANFIMRRNIYQVSFSHCYVRTIFSRLQMPKGSYPVLGLHPLEWNKKSKRIIHLRYSNTIIYIARCEYDTTDVIDKFCSYLIVLHLIYTTVVVVTWWEKERESKLYRNENIYAERASCSRAETKEKFKSKNTSFSLWHYNDNIYSYYLRDKK